jgi:hypothetical protein
MKIHSLSFIVLLGLIPPGCHHVYDNIAAVKVDSTDYMDYLQIGKVQGRWVIVNVLWAPRK